MQKGLFTALQYKAKQIKWRIDSLGEPTDLPIGAAKKKLAPFKRHSQEFTQRIE